MLMQTEPMELIRIDIIQSEQLTSYDVHKESYSQRYVDVVQGTFHQGHPRLSENSGKQCVLNSLSALLYSREKSMSV